MTPSFELRKASPQDLALIVHGATPCCDDPSGTLAFSRFTEPLAALYDTSDSTRIRRACTAGVALRFRSSATRLEAAFTFGVRARQNIALDLLVAGELVAPILPQGNATGWEGLLWEGEGAHLRDFELWLPPMAETRLASLIGDAPFLPPHPLERRWLALGDSITQGMEASTPTRNWPARVALAGGWHLHNAGVGGAILDARLGRAISGESYRLLTLAFGTNDYNRGRPLAEFEAACMEFFTTVDLPAGAQCGVIAPAPFMSQPVNNAGLSLDRYREVLAAVCARFDRVHYIGTPIPEDPACFPPDDCHPNDLGMERYAATVLAHLKSAGWSS